jgi:hypothetical protein
MSTVAVAIVVAVTLVLGIWECVRASRRTPLFGVGYRAEREEIARIRAALRAEGLGHISGFNVHNEGVSK